MNSIKEILDILACPVTKGPLIYDAEKNELIGLAAGLAYPIRDGIPILLSESARELSADEREHYKKTSKKSPPV